MNLEEAPKKTALLNRLIKLSTQYPTELSIIDLT